MCLVASCSCLASSLTAVTTRAPSSCAPLACPYQNAQHTTTATSPVKPAKEGAGWKLLGHPTMAWPTVSSFPGAMTQAWCLQRGRSGLNTGLKWANPTLPMQTLTPSTGYVAISTCRQHHAQVQRIWETDVLPVLT